MFGIWQTFMMTHLIVLVIAVFLLIKTKIPSIDKFFWALLMFFIPPAGSIWFLFWRRRL
jgi:hypothetical protein